MKTFFKRTLLLFVLTLFGTSAFGQSFTLNNLQDTTGWSYNCDSIVDLDFWVNDWGWSQNVDHIYYIGTNGNLTPGNELIVTIDWGDGTSSTYTGIYQAPTLPLFATGTVQHIYSSSGGSSFPITVTVINPLNNSTISNANYTFYTGCPIELYDFTSVDCDNDGTVDSVLYSGVDMILTDANGTTFPFTTAGTMNLVQNIPPGNYTLTVDPLWLIANNYQVQNVTPSTIMVQSGGSNIITYQVSLTCITIPLPTDGCVFGQVFCDYNGDGFFDSNEVGVYNAPVSITYNNQTVSTYTDPNGFYSLAAPNGYLSTGIVTVDANWLSQNGYQFTSNVMTTTIEDCVLNTYPVNFPVNCDSVQTATECIYGWVFCDANANGTLDSGEVVLPNAPVEVSGTSGYTTTIYSDSNGVVSYSGQAFFGGFAVLTIPQWWLTQHGYTLSNNVFTIQTDCNNPTPVYFGVDCSPVLCADLWTTVNPWIGYYQNQNNYIKLKWGNYGPNATTGFTLTLTFPSSVTPDASSIANSNYVISGNTITWTFGPGASYIYEQDIIKFFVPSGFPSGTSHTYSSTITPLGSTADCDLLNNDGSLCMILGNSYDPNDKSTSHTPIIDPTIQDELTYVLRFQNTGTAPAQDVYIIDSLSTNLDWSTLKVISASHNMQLVDLGNGVMKFNFPGIWLPDSTANEPESHGDVVFSIKENVGNGIGTAIENTGYIYFDWNPAIITNTTVNVNDALNLEDVEINEVSISPNPSAGTLKISSQKEIDQVAVVDITGKIIFKTSVNGFDTQLKLDHMMNGMYLVKVISGTQVSTVRWVKK